MVDGDGSECGECQKKVKDKGIQCETCNKWFHVECAGLTEQLYKAVTKYKGGHKWLCEVCDKALGGVLKNITGIMERQERQEKMEK